MERDDCTFDSVTFWGLLLGVHVVKNNSLKINTFKDICTTNFVNLGHYVIPIFFINRP